MRERCRLNVACPNPSCKLFGKKRMKNVVMRGKKLNGTLNYTCANCGRCFAATSGTLFYHSRIKTQQAKQIISLVMAEMGIRRISRITCLNKNTVSKFVNKIAEERKMTNTFLLNELGFTKKDINELWPQISKLKR